MILRAIHDDIYRRVRLLAEQAGHQPTVAVDLDGTLTVDAGFTGPDEIAEVRDGASAGMKQLRDWGFRIIIFTVRNNIDRIKEWLEDNDIPYDHINENPDQPEDSSGKVISDLYIDDRSVDGRLPWDKLVKIVKRRLRKAV